MTVLDQLREAGIRIDVSGAKPMLRGRLSLHPELVALAKANRDQILADLAEQETVERAFGCHSCGFAVPTHTWPREPRRCIRCGQVEQ